MTQQEASEELDIPLGTIKSRLKIGLRELKKSMIHKQHNYGTKITKLFSIRIIGKICSW